VVLLAPAVAFVVGVAATFVALSVFDGDEAEAEVTLMSFDDAGDDPFTTSVAPAPPATLSDFAETSPAVEDLAGTDEAVDGDADGDQGDVPAGAGVPAAGRGGYRHAGGDRSGIFGGTLDELACHADQLAAQLGAEQAKQAAWASVFGLDIEAIESYVDGLTAVNLVFDTRVVDHGYAAGAPVPRQAVLQRGTSVLVDARGVPRVNCHSGNPLLDPTIADKESYVGERWPAFDPELVLVIVASPVDRDGFELVDIATGEAFERPAGTEGDADLGAGESDGGSATVDLADSDAVELDTPVSVEKADASTELRYVVEVPDSATLSLTVTNQRDSTGRIATSVVSEGERLTFFRVDAGGSETYTLTLDHDGGGPFEVLFSEGPAQFDFLVSAQLQDDGGRGADAGDEVASAVEIASGERIEGLLGGHDQADSYRLPVDGAPTLVLTRETPADAGGRTAFDVLVNGERLDFTRVDPGGSEVYNVLLGPEDDGTVEILLTEGQGGYGFVAELVTQSDGGQPGDASAELAEARTLTELTGVVGEVGNRDRGDHYLFEAIADEMTIDVSVDATAETRVAVALAGPDGDSLSFFRVSPGATGTETFDAVPGETYRLLITEGRGVYTVDLS
jgi:hypothetical protein